MSRDYVHYPSSKRLCYVKDDTIRRCSKSHRAHVSTDRALEAGPQATTCSRIDRLWASFG